MYLRPALMTHVYNPNTQEVGAGRSQVHGQPWPHSEVKTSLRNLVRPGLKEYVSGQVFTQNVSCLITRIETNRTCIGACPTPPKNQTKTSNSTDHQLVNIANTVNLLFQGHFCDNRGKCRGESGFFYYTILGYRSSLWENLRKKLQTAHHIIFIIKRREK